MRNFKTRVMVALATVLFLVTAHHVRPVFAGPTESSTDAQFATMLRQFCLDNDMSVSAVRTLWDSLDFQHGARFVSELQPDNGDALARTYDKASKSEGAMVALNPRGLDREAYISTNWKPARVLYIGQGVFQGQLVDLVGEGPVDGTRFQKCGLGGSFQSIVGAKEILIKIFELENEETLPYGLKFTSQRYPSYSFHIETIFVDASGSGSFFFSVISQHNS